MVRFAGITFEISDKTLHGGSALAGFVLLGAFLISFAFIRTSARLIRSPRVSWWPGSVKTSGGLHIHHLVWGIALILISGFLAIALRLHSPWLEIVAGGFGVGAGLTLDEYALWLHLEDVYWAEEGRRSIDAVIVAASIGGLILLGVRPIDASTTTSAFEIAAALLILLALCALALIKGRFMLGLVGLVLPPLALIAAMRLAKPGSPWARWRYPPDSRRLRRATRRFERHAARYQRLQDWVGGAPSLSAPPQADQRELPTAGGAGPGLQPRPRRRSDL